MKNLSANPWPWLAGILLAFTGVAIARLGPDMLGGSARSAVFAGRVLAVAGIGVIMFGIRQRLRREEISDPDATDTPAD